ncbi:phage holin, lambda family [Pseudomonas aeruginosa]
MQMPEKDPSLWAALLAWLSLYQPQLYASGLSVGIAILRVVYGGGTRRQMLLEGALCGLVTLALVPLLEWMGLPQSMATFAGGAVGFMGVEKLRDVADRIADWKLPRRGGE